MIVHTPTSEEEACTAIAEAIVRRTPLAIVGGSTKDGIGRPVQHAATLTSAAMTGITLYEPAELVVSARAGTSLHELQRTLAAEGQMLAFEPMEHAALLGSDGEATVGGIVAANISGPRRIAAGACRDSLIGLRFVNGRSEVVKSGGRVMKNVTGLDLVKLLAGSWGTLGFVTEATFKVQPCPQRMATIILEGLDDERAITALSAALGSPYEVTGAAHLPANLDDSPARTVLRLEGFSFSVDHRLAALRSLLRPHGEAALMEGEAAETLWRDVRDVRFLAEPRTRAVWRISTAPSRGPALVAAIARVLDARWFFDWGGGLVWLATDAAGDAGAAAIRAAVATAGGHATLVRAPVEVRAAVDVFEPQSAAVQRLTLGIKHAFDPERILEPGRMYAGV
ncbi:glycolate oxidase subunit GlcE [Chelatococcus sp. SYSU_G07232]|uniref:Glycolate oxidase subunit GlcE n=1 Tax=Chelatococcus albus TaxID=3047466 RepID=A0ABT7AFP0_9HYPH|nr:glycolate oxidase subunit GlcE [Chelatococcus sp. SYSU_G07232]MDJ1157915.1 glycolate oxidase subunit GlcE [Chelatococcus sp. SYSU_G07232]